MERVLGSRGVASRVARVLPFDADEIEGTLPDRFARVVRDVNGRTAIQDGAERPSYGELARRSGQIAHAILERSPPGNDAVALLFGQGMSAIAALLGTLEAGKIYVPLDPLYPTARLDAIVADAGARVIVTDAAHRDLARRWASVTVLELEALGPDAPADVPRPPTTPDSPAYIIYTSGSTGRPKGVIQTHRNVLFDIRRQARDLGTTIDDRYGLLFAAASSASVCHIFGALLSGAAVHPFDVRERGFPALARWLADDDITVLDINVATFRELCATLDGRGAFPRLRLLAPGSEPVLAADVELYRRHFAATCIMQNALGTTETRTVTQFFLTKETPLDEAMVPIGWDVPGKRVRLLDEEGTEVAPGETGEIAVFSRYLSPGYWGNAEATDAVFRRTPDGERFYLTGDLGRRRADGCLVHVGRKDFQVKVRGHRVETAEVETALVGHAGVTHAAVVAVPDAHGSARLVAYVVPRADRPPTAADLRAHLRLLLPAPMVPAQFVFLATPPLTANGKLDRRALPAHERIRGASEPTPPETSLERRLLRVWSAVLDVENLGIDDDFFALGGDSLLAVRICAELESEIGARLAASRLWEAPTVRRLAAALEVPPDPRRRLVAIQPHGRRPPLVCLPGAEGSALAFAQLARWLGDDQPLYAFEAPGTDGLEPPLDRIEDLASRYLAELARLRPRGPYQLAGYSVGGLVAFEMAQRLVAAGEAVDLVALLDSSEPRQVPLPVVETVRRLRRLASHGAFEAVVEQATTALGWSVKRRFLPWVVRACTAMGQAVPPAARRWQVIQAHVRARAGYRPRPYPGPLMLLRAVDSGDPAGAPSVWAALARGGLVVHDVAGSHDFLVEPFVGALARELAACLLGPSSPTCLSQFS